MEFEALGRDPILPEQPAGADLQGDPLFDALDVEIGKSVSVTAGVADWDKIARLAAEILHDKSKHLLVACYLCVGIAKKDGLRGLAAGSEMLHVLLRTYWDALFPPLRRMRARRNAIEWWREQIQSLISGLPAEKWKPSDRDKFVADLKGIDDFLSNHLDDAPLLHPLFEEVGRLIECETPIPVAAAATNKTATPVPIASAAASAPAPVAVAAAADSTLNPEKLIDKGMEILNQAADLLLAQAPLTALPLQLNRMAAWLPVQELPPAHDGITRIQPPDSRVIAAFERLRQEEDWRDLLNSAESHVSRFLFWIDLQRYVDEALRGLNKPDLASVVTEETWRYVERLSGMERLAFSNGMPFADLETMEWLREIKAQQQRSNSACAPVQADDIVGAVAAELAAAKDVASTKSLAPVLTIFNDRMRHSASARDRLHWQLGLCRLLLRAQKTHLAAVHVNEILCEVEKYGICSWDPELAVESLTTVLTCVKAKPDAFEDGLSEIILGKIALLNPAKALDYL